MQRTEFLRRLNPLKILFEIIVGPTPRQTEDINVTACVKNTYSICE